ncbi:hypothetical protein ATL39_3059 [Sinobaca qinghaiensis]|uniref:Uncharacterized protein n=1 Tax=Sinobaca qinghaiensis TaxID=342944 RepID=A0A419UWX2_9BACL|nr:hypothetical protein [Sinobaca qinghaiensis]RKD69635.1 hypothetical protein ATL39_3059 [Sinobaca qinghaiensis]
MTFEKRLAALDKILDIRPQNKSRKNSTTNRSRLEVLDQLEDEQQAILQEMGITLYPDNEGSPLIVNLEDQSVRMTKEERGEKGKEVIKIREQQARIIKELEQYLCPKIEKEEEIDKEQWLEEK